MESRSITILFGGLLLLSQVQPGGSLSYAQSSRQVASPHNGKNIRRILVNVKPIFDEEPLGVGYRAVNALKITTKEKVIRRELIFAEGEPYDEFLIQESARNLRTQRFLREIEIETLDYGDEVDVVIHAQEAWTLVPQVGLSSSGGQKKQSIGIADSNVLGYGKRFEILRRKVDERENVEFVWEDPRLLNSWKNLTTAYSDRNDGREFTFSIGRPFRSLANKTSWLLSADSGDLVGRLFENDDESYIYRVQNDTFRARYIFALGDPSQLLRRFTVGFDSVAERFKQAGLREYDALDLHPERVSNDPSRLAGDRVYRGLVLGYNSITPDFISTNYIDRFDRATDYNIGAQRSLQLFFTPQAFGSTRDAIHFNVTRSGGIRYAEKEFLRSEFGFSNRVESSNANNNLFRAETQYYNVVGAFRLGELYLGRHTLAARGFAEYGGRLDRDRQLLIGSEEGALRGYRARSFSGDKRFAINLEDRVFLVDDVFRLFSIGAVSFLDIGGATYRPFGNLLTKDTYADVGIGLRVGIPRSSGGGVIGVDLALPLRDSADGTDAFAPRILFQAGQAFSSRLRSETVGTERLTTGVGFDR